MNDYYDFIVLSVTNPAFSENTDLMIQNILDAKATSPTIKIETVVIDDSDPENIITETKPTQRPMIGTKENIGRIMLHFRLPVKMEETELIDMLKDGMSNPKPPISVESIESATKNIYVDDGLDDDGNPMGHYEYDVVVEAKRARFLPYMIEDTDEDGNPLGTINEFLAGYVKDDNIKLA